jgi:hypothetical protein
VLACAVISAPAFAQSSLPQCPHQLTYHQEPCSNLQFDPSPPPSLFPPPINREPDWDTTGFPHDYRRPNPPEPPSTSEILRRRWEDSGPIYNEGMGQGQGGGSIFWRKWGKLPMPDDDD